MWLHSISIYNGFVKELESGIAYHILKEIFLVMNYLSTTRSVL